MRAPLVLVAVALLVVAGAVTAGISLRDDKPTRDACAGSDSPRCAQSDCNPERPACQEQQRNARLRAYCADHPRDEKCR